MSDIAKPGPIFCYEVYHWPEFRALCARLGIPCDLRTKRLVIDLPGPNETVLVTQEYLGTDEAGPTADAVIDTTALANERQRTYRPPMSQVD